MAKRFISFGFSIWLVLSIVSSSSGFDNNQENFDPNTKKPIPYTSDNINSGALTGGHDTLTAEGMKLKEQVHQQTDADGGENFKTWSNTEALSPLRTGAHDEDTYKIPLFGYYNNDAPIGPNGSGDFFNHFFDPDTGNGFKWAWDPATKRAKDYGTEIAKKTGCSPDGTNNFNKLTQAEKEKVYDMFGRILHLIEDMGNPAHTKNDAHVFTATFEDYVNNNWSSIVNSDSFKNSVTVGEYLVDNYEVASAQSPEQFIEALANISKNYYTDGFFTSISPDELSTNVDVLIPETIKYVGGYIDAIYKEIGSSSQTGLNTEQGIMLATLEQDIYKLAQLVTDPNNTGAQCEPPPPDPEDPANDHPDDRFDVSDEFYWEKEFKLSDADLTSLYMRSAVKKGKIGVWYKMRLMEIFFEGRSKYKDAPKETKDAIEAEFQAMGRRLEERRNQVKNDWKGAPDIALFANGFYKPSISLMLKLGEPVSFEKVDLDPGIVKDHPVLLVPTGGFYGLEQSAIVRSVLDEYVKNGGTLVMFAQQHGADYGLLPAPVDPQTGERRTVLGYGYQEDQSCQFNSVYIDTYHPILSVFSTSTANIGVDGYFTSYPENSTILLRRTANGQPAMIMYPYGNGHVIATTLYTDFAFSHSQANTTEINLVQNIISWAKRPDTLTEIKPGGPLT